MYISEFSDSIKRTNTERVYGFLFLKEMSSKQFELLKTSNTLKFEYYDIGSCALCFYTIILNRLWLDKYLYSNPQLWQLLNSQNYFQKSSAIYLVKKRYLGLVTVLRNTTTHIYWLYHLTFQITDDCRRIKFGVSYKYSLINIYRLL